MPTKSITLKPGDHVRITETITDRDYTAEGIAKRKALAGQKGKITGSSDGHGLCYQVETPSGETAYFDPDELTKVRPPRNKNQPGILRRGATVKITTKLVSDGIHKWSPSAQKDRLAHRGQSGKIVSGGTRQGTFGVTTEDKKTSYYKPTELTPIRKTDSKKPAHPTVAPDSHPPLTKAQVQPIRIHARVDIGLGNFLTLHTSQNWEEGIPMTNLASDLWEAKTPSLEPIEFKVRLNGAIWETGENHTVTPGSSTTISPNFN